MCTSDPGGFISCYKIIHNIITAIVWSEFNFVGKTTINLLSGCNKCLTVGESRGVNSPAIQNNLVSLERPNKDSDSTLTDD